jgi:hypothetical protein
MKTLVYAVFSALVLLAAAGCKRSAAAQEHDAVAVQQATESWDSRTLAGAYPNAGHTNPKWDDVAKAALTEFALMRSGQSSVAEASGTISNSCVAALGLGCDDPMIRYLAVRYVIDPSQTAQQVADALCAIAPQMEGSSYPAIRKYYVWIRAGQQVNQAYGYGANVPPRIDSLNIWSHAEDDLMQALDDKGMPAQEILEAAVDLLDVWRADKQHYAQIYQNVESRLGPARANTAPALLLKGIANIQMAWHARGNGYADTITPEGGRQFDEHLGIAADALGKAWDLNPTEPRIAYQMMRCELGQGKGRDRMELWFGRAMKLNANNYDACDEKLNYLEPKWYGSIEDMLVFGRQCVTNEAWGGHVPLILMDAHRAIQNQDVEDEQEKAKYWSRPEVWADLKSAFTRFFALNPDEIGWRHNYAWYAYQAGDWQTFNDMVPKLGPINYEFFGGKDEFDRMVAKAKGQ